MMNQTNQMMLQQSTMLGHMGRFFQQQAQAGQQPGAFPFGQQPNVPPAQAWGMGGGPPASGGGPMPVAPSMSSSSSSNPPQSSQSSLTPTNLNSRFGSNNQHPGHK